MNIAEESPSTTLPAPVVVGAYHWGDATVGMEYDVGPYQVCTRIGWFGKKSMMLQICRSDGGSVFDWRDLQQIKTMICGPEWEAVELFPAESRLKDPSNARYLWAKAGPFPFGIPGPRVVIDAPDAFAPQRPFPKEPQ